MDKIPFSDRCLRRDSLMMLNCSARRSIIRTVAHMKKKGMKEYTNKKWTVKRLGIIQHYSVTDRATGTVYLVIDYEDVWLGESGFGVYKKVEKK